MLLQTAGVLIVKESILHSQSDNLIKCLIKELNSLHYSIMKVAVVSQSESLIFNELESMTKICDVIIAVPDKSELFYQIMGAMISQPLQENKDLIQIFDQHGTSYSKEDVFLPPQARIIENSGQPIIYFQRIFIFKERFLKQGFSKSVRCHLTEYRKEKIFEKIIKISKNGNHISDFTELLNSKSCCITVNESKNDDFVLIKLSSLNFIDFVACEQKVQERFKAHYLNFVDNSYLWENIYHSTQKHVANALKHIEDCLDTYGVSNTFLSFNGGKDCTVLLHLVQTVIKKKYLEYNRPIFCLYVQNEESFGEQEEFIKQAECFFNLNVKTIKSSIKEALHQILKESPNYKACLMGTRRTDPYSNELHNFQMTDSNWPQIMRVCPLLDWHYSDIWEYLLYYKVPYCKLYDAGYTSLGSSKDTERNPSLLYRDPFTQKDLYLPAYKLLNENRERNGRNHS